jgi:exocyst complex component 3
MMTAGGPASAAQAIGEFLQSPDDLAKVAKYRKKLEKEKASIDARLKNGVKEQLQATREGLRKLLSTRANVQAIKDEMVSVERQCSDPQNVVTTFDQISRVHYSMPFIVTCVLIQVYRRCQWCTGILNGQKRWSTICLR